MLALWDGQGQDQVTGMDLKVERIRARVTTIALAERAGYSTRVRISEIEAKAAVSEKVARRYLEALRTFEA